MSFWHRGFLSFLLFCSFEGSAMEQENKSLINTFKGLSNSYKSTKNSSQKPQRTQSSDAASNFRSKAEKIEPSPQRSKSWNGLISKTKKSSKIKITIIENKNYYTLWPLDNNIILGSEIILCSKSQANEKDIFLKLKQNNVGTIFLLYNASNDMDKLDDECGNKLDQIFSELNIELSCQKNFKCFEKFILENPPNEKSKPMYIFALDDNKLNYEFMIQLTIKYRIKDAHEKRERFSINNKLMCFTDILVKEDTLKELAAILTDQAFHSVFENNLDKKTSIFTDIDIGLMQAFARERLERTLEGIKSPRSALY